MAASLREGLCCPGFQVGFVSTWVPHEGEHTTRHHVQNPLSVKTNPDYYSGNTYIRAPSSQIPPATTKPGAKSGFPLGAVTKGDPAAGKCRRTMFHVTGMGKK